MKFMIGIIYRIEITMLGKILKITLIIITMFYPVLLSNQHKLFFVHTCDL